MLGPEFDPFDSKGKTICQTFNLPRQIRRFHLITPFQQKARPTLIFQQSVLQFPAAGKLCRKTKRAVQCLAFRKQVSGFCFFVCLFASSIQRIRDNQRPVHKLFSRLTPPHPQETDPLRHSCPGGFSKTSLITK